MGMYVLDEHGNPKEVDDVREWGRFIESKSRRVEFTEEDGYIVSTVFLGIDHSFDGGAPLLWETMIFGGKGDGKCWRYSSKEEAVAGHAKAVAIARGGL